MSRLNLDGAAYQIEAHGAIQAQRAIALVRSDPEVRDVLVLSLAQNASPLYTRAFLAEIEKHLRAAA